MDAPLLYSLIALTLGALAIGATGPAFVAAVLLGNLLTCWIISEALGNGFNYFALASIDLVSAMFILFPPVTRGQIAVAATYVFGLCCHAAYAALGESLVTQGQYWSALFFMAWGQVCIVVIWAGVDGIGVYRSGNHPISRLYARWHLLRSGVPEDGR